jgi:hypothetical protein
VLDRSRAALRRRRAGQAVGAACVALLLVLGALTRGPVPLPWVGPVVLPGGDLIARLLDEGPTDEFGPALEPAGSTPVPCPEELPGPTPTGAPGPGEDTGPLVDPVVVDVGDARPLTCYDADVEVVTPGSLDGSGLRAAPYGERLPEPRGLSGTGQIWAFDGADLLDDDGATDGATDGASIVSSGWTGGGSSDSLTSYQGSRTSPTGLAVTGDRTVWSEYSPASTSPRRSFLRAHVSEVTEDGYGGTTWTVTSSDERLWLLAVARDHVLWTAGDTADDTRLFATNLDGDGTPTELAAGVTALAADEGEAVAAVLTPGSGQTSTTAILRFDDTAGGNLNGTLLMELEHDSSSEVTQIAVSDDLIAWTVSLGADGPSTLYVFDRVGDGDSIVRVPDGAVDDLRASGGLLSWTSTQRGVQDPAAESYLYRATASASGYDGPDLARFPGGSVTAGLAGARTAWLEDAGARQWLVKAAVTPTLDRG